MSFLDCGGVRLALGPAGEPVHGPDPVVGFRVNEIEKSARALKSRGVVFDREPHLVAHLPERDLWMALFHDDDGNRLALIGEETRCEETTSETTTLQ